jgi:hypothetical protein
MVTNSAMRVNDLALAQIGTGIPRASQKTAGSPAEICARAKRPLGFSGRNYALNDEPEPVR